MLASTTLTSTESHIYIFGLIEISPQILQLVDFFLDIDMTKTEDIPGHAINVHATNPPDEHVQLLQPSPAGKVSPTLCVCPLNSHCSEKNIQYIKYIGLFHKLDFSACYIAVLHVQYPPLAQSSI